MIRSSDLPTPEQAEAYLRQQLGDEAYEYCDASANPKHSHAAARALQEATEMYIAEGASLEDAVATAVGALISMTASRAIKWERAQQAASKSNIGIQ